MTMTKKKKQILGGVIAVILLACGYIAYQRFTTVTTDNAQVGGPVVLLAARVSGVVIQVNVQENTSVKRGDVLAEVDPADYRTAFAAAEAQTASIEARFREAEVNLKRAQSLFHTQAISRERLENAQATFKDLDAKYKAVAAARDQAQLNLQYTKIVAPADGTISRRSLEVGQMLGLGQVCFGFVDDSSRWISANLKETQLTDVRLGQKTEIEVDALPHRKFNGQVESISPSTGAVFSLLPPDNATGNFTKVVQRVPVRIKLLDLRPEDLKQLQVGLSAAITIFIR